MIHFQAIHPGECRSVHLFCVRGIRYVDKVLVDTTINNTEYHGNDDDNERPYIDVTSFIHLFISNVIYIHHGTGIVSVVRSEKYISHQN